MRTKEDFAKQNAYNREKYFHINAMIPKQDAAIWKEFAQQNNLSLNALIKAAVNEYIAKITQN